ncbi:MAG: ATP-binding protein [Fusobacteriaceae bacterium]
MILKKMRLENFRGYQNARIEFDENLNVIIGKNDVGKSTILEALEIYFNSDIIKPDQGDLNIFSKKNGGNMFKITCCFEVNKKNEILLDCTNKTTFENEFILNKDNMLEIIQEFSCDKAKITPQIFIKINYPIELENHLNLMKLADLKAKVKAMNIESEVDDKTKKENYRGAIYNNIDDINRREEKIFQIDKNIEGYNLWDKLRMELPLYFLFQSDRSNTDKDSEIQNPLRVAAKEVLIGLNEEIESIKNIVKEKVESIGKDTIEELKKFNPDIANILKVDLSTKSFDSLFSFNIVGDDEIPLNKRGSGIRRLMLLSYFMAVAKKKHGDKKVIYAIEEPETAQHPNFQSEILETLRVLSKTNYQIILTTHSPQIAKQMQEENIIFIKKCRAGNNEIIKDTETKIKDVAETLGIFPTVLPKVIVSVEGDTDVRFFKTVGKIEELKNIVDLDKENIGFIPQKGGKILEWITRDYLADSETKEIIICDRDSEVYVKKIDELNATEDQRRAGFVTDKYEIENYIHPKLYNDLYETNFSYDENWNDLDIPKTLCDKLKDSPKYKSYTSDKKIQNDIKIQISENLLDKITKDYLIDIGAFDELKKIFEKINSFK